MRGNSSLAPERLSSLESSGSATALGLSRAFLSSETLSGQGPYVGCFAQGIPARPIIAVSEVVQSWDIGLIIEGYNRLCKAFGRFSQRTQCCVEALTKSYDLFRLCPMLVGTPFRTALGEPQSVSLFSNLLFLVHYLRLFHKRPRRRFPQLLTASRKLGFIDLELDRVSASPSEMDGKPAKPCESCL